MDYEKIIEIKDKIDDLSKFYLINDITHNKMVLECMIELKRLSFVYIKKKDINEYFLKNKQRTYNFFKLINSIIDDIKIIINNNKKINNYDNFLNIITDITNICEYFTS
jgi:hypothetical protein